MSIITKKYFTDLHPVRLEYNFFNNENLHKKHVSFNNGLDIFTINSTQNYKDVTFNKNTCFILTSAIQLSSVFATKDVNTIGNIPVSILVQPRTSTVYFAKHHSETNTIRLELTSSSTFLLQPTNIKNNIEIIIDGKYLEISKNYPYTAFLNKKATDNTNQTFQLFEPVTQDGLITFKTLTKDGYRYLAFNSDNILRATGLILNEAVISDYVFSYTLITNTNINYNFLPSNNWVTYFYDVELKNNNKNVLINKNLLDVPTNFLIEFPYNKAVLDNIAKINIINLKTGVTPTGGPAPIENVYEKLPITTNE